MFRNSIITAFAFSCFVASLVAQDTGQPSLGEFARQQREKNKTPSNGGTVFTNDGIATQRPASQAGGPARINEAAAASPARTDVDEGELGVRVIRTTSSNAQTPVAISPDYRMFATAVNKEPIRLWDLTTGSNIREMGSISGSIEQLVFSADGKRLASLGFQHPASVWDVETGVILRQMDTRAAWGVIALSPDGRMLATGSGSGEILLFDVATGKQVSSLRTNAKMVESLAFSPDGRWLAAGEDTRQAGAAPLVALWEIATQRLVRTLSGHTNNVGAVAFSPDGRIMATGQYGPSMVKVWHVATGAELRTLSDKNWAVAALAFSPNGRWLVVGFGMSYGRISIWDVSTGEELFRGLDFSGYRMWGVATLKYKGLGIRAVAFSPNGDSLAVGDLDGSVRIWDVPKVVAAAQHEKAERERAAKLAEERRLHPASAIPHETIGLKDCGTDFACFIKAFEDGNPVMMRRTRTDQPKGAQGIKVTEKAYAQASNFTAGQATYYTRLEDISVEITDEGREWLLQQGAAEQQFNEQARQMVGHELACLFTRESLDALLHNWSKGQFEGIDFVRADWCEGNYIPLGAGMISQTITHTERAWWFAQDGKFDEAEKELNVAMVKDPEYKLPEAHQQLGEIYERKGNRDFAIPEFRKAVELQPDSTTGWDNLGLEYARQGSLDKAVECYRKQLDVNAKQFFSSSDPYFHLCTLYGDDGPIEKNVPACEEGIKKFPNDALMWNELGWIYATSKDPHFRDPSKALEYAQKAVSLSEGKSPEILDTLAEAYYVNRDYDKAIETETKALKLTPDNVLFKRSLERYQRMKNGKT